MVKHDLRLQELNIKDEPGFLVAMQASQTFHSPWVKVPLTHEEFIDYHNRSKLPTHKSYLLVNSSNNLIGVFNLSEIVRGVFQNAYLGFYGVEMYSKKGYMNHGLKLLLEKVFIELKLHRIEANIQPNNIKSIQLVQKNGFRKEGFSPRYLKINEEWCDHERWALTFEDWQSLTVVMP